MDETTNLKPNAAAAVAAMTAALPADGRGYGSHLPVLLEMLLLTQGPVLEMGAGIWSTPMLVAACRASNRPLVTVEENEDWLIRARNLCGFEHELHQVLHSYDSELIDAIDWSVVLIDHAKDRRQRDLVRLKDRAEFLVVHDACHPKVYGYDFSMFRRQAIYKALKPWTAVLSNK